MASGFEYVDNDLFPVIDVKLNGVSISIKQLAEAAEAMRVELLNYGIVVQVKESA